MGKQHFFFLIWASFLSSNEENSQFLAEISLWAVK